jgi:hypothetical protein
LIDNKRKAGTIPTNVGWFGLELKLFKGCTTNFGIKKGGGKERIEGKYYRKAGWIKS